MEKMIYPCPDADGGKDGVTLGEGSQGSWEAQEGAKQVEGPAMERPEMVTGAAPRGTVLPGQEPPGRVEEVAAGLACLAHYCSQSLLARA